MKLISKVGFFLSIIGIFIGSCQERGATKLSGKYMMINRHKSLVALNKYDLYPNKIYPTIIDVEFDSSYILVEQSINLDMLIHLVAGDHKRSFIRYSTLLSDRSTVEDQLLIESIMNDSVNYNRFISLGVSSVNDNTLGPVSITIAQEIIASDPKFRKMVENKINYWVLTVSNDSLYGPMTKGEYLSKRQALGVPEKLKLTFED